MTSSDFFGVILANARIHLDLNGMAGVTMQETFAEALEARTQDVLDNCTSCGRCFEVCPMTAPAGIAAANPSETVSGVLRVLQGGSGTPEAERWAEVCSGSGTCIPACPENVNPRFML